MRTNELDKDEEFEEYKPPKKLGNKSKADCSKVSKESKPTRRRQQPDSSEEYLLPDNIPQTTGSELTITEGFENELTKVVINVPYSMIQNQKFQLQTSTHVLDLGIIFSIEKQHDNISLLARLPSVSRKMQVEEQKLREPTSDHSHGSQTEQELRFFDIGGKYVYLSGYENQNKLIKRGRKQLSSLLFTELIKFKIKEPYSDLFFYLQLKAEEYLTDDYIGLVNQGNTCYMNSYLQTLYHLPAVRNLVYEAQIQDETKFPATLQQLFYDLDNCMRAASPEALVKSFGWGKHEASIQQDAQEFSCLFFEVLQRKLNDSEPKAGYKSKNIEQLFKGSLDHYIRCTHVGTVIDYTDFRNEMFEQFMDLQLPIAPTLTQALDLYTSETHLQGDNAYQTEEYGKQQAFKGVKLGHLPPILMIQLKRFQYSFEDNKNIKVLASLEYEDEIDFAKWTSDGEENIYELYAVLVHEGARAESGHYFNYVKVCDQWYKFNDEWVQKVSRERVFDFNFGGFHETVDFDAKEMKVTKKFLESKTTAYMLVYIKKSQKEELMKDDNRLPEWIEMKNINKQQMEEDKKHKKNFIHNVGLIDWQVNLKGSICSDDGFLTEHILENAKTIIPQIPKEALLEEWLVEQKLIEPKIQPVEEKKKKSKKAKSSDPAQKQEPGIYIFYATDREILVGFPVKTDRKMVDLFKTPADPILFKAPFQAKKDEYVVVIKRYSVEKRAGNVETSFIYDTLIPVKKETTFTELMSLLVDKFVKENVDQRKSIQYNFYLDDLKQGPINLSTATGIIPVQSPKTNQLLVCVVQEIHFEMSKQEEELYSFFKHYQRKKNMITVTVNEEKGDTVLNKTDIPGSENLGGLRKIIFENLSEEKRAQYGSSQNIVLKAKIKKGSKAYTEVSEPDWKTVKDITKIDERIEFTFSILTVESRLSKFMIQIHYRNRQREISEPINLVLDKEVSSEILVKIIKSNPAIVEMLKNDGFNEDEAELILLNRQRNCINDIVSNEGKVIGRGDFENVIRKQKNLVIVVEGRNVLKMQIDSGIEINEEEFDPIVNILVHHVGNSGDKIGNPIFLKVDRRMQLSELNAKILDLIKDQVFFWEGKVYACEPSKVNVELFGKDGKKVFQLTEWDDSGANNQLKVDDKANLENGKRKKSKQLTNTPRKQSAVEQNKEAPLEIVKEDQKPQKKEDTVIQLNEEEEKQIAEKKISVESKSDGQKLAHEINVIEISDDIPEAKEKPSEEQNDDEPIEDAEKTKIEGPQTIFGVLPKPKILRIRVLNSYITRPNYVLKLRVDE